MTAAATVICATCRHWQLRASPEHAQIGFAPCALDRRTGVFKSSKYPHVCAQHAALDADSIARRLKFLDRRRAGVHEEREQARAPIHQSTGATQ